MKDGECVRVYKCKIQSSIRGLRHGDHMNKGVAIREGPLLREGG